MLADLARDIVKVLGCDSNEEVVVARLAVERKIREALKNPTPEMTLVGARSIGQTIGMENHNERAKQCWQAMVNKFLEE